MSPLALYFLGMSSVLLIESVIPSPGRVWSFGAGVFGIFLIVLDVALS